MTKIRVNKPEAVRRQTNAGVRMLFGGEDPLAVITVASAAFGIARDLAKKTGCSDMEQLFKDKIKPGKEREFWSTVNHPANFLKHANRDPLEVLTEIHEEASEAILLMCVLYYRELGYERTDEMNALITWFGILNPEILMPDNPLREYSQYPEAEKIRNLPRSDQLKCGQMMLKKRYEKSEAPFAYTLG